MSLAISNLQALCSRCKAGKRDTAVGQRQQPHRCLGIQESYRQRQDGCIFCALEGGGRVLLERTNLLS